MDIAGTSPSFLLFTFGLTLVVYFTVVFAKQAYKHSTSSLYSLSGPKKASWIYGNLGQLFSPTSASVQHQWIQEFGPTFAISLLAHEGRHIYTSDLKAIRYILTRTYVYQKPEPHRYGLSSILGNGLLVVEGDVHKQQRKVLNPAFATAHVRELTNVFFEKSLLLRDRWLEETAEGKAGRINALSWLSRVTLDVIGAAGFNYQFNALRSGEKGSKLSRAFRMVTKDSSQSSLMRLLQNHFKPLRLVPSYRYRIVRDAKNVMVRIGRELLRESKASVMADSCSREVRKGDLRGRNILTLLVKANAATDIPSSQRLSDEDVLAQIPTFLIAGHETTSTSTTWALFALSQSQAAQKKLRNELMAIDMDTPSMEELNGLPYLDWVVRETLRLYSPVPLSIREAMEDDCIPLDTPFVDKNGVAHHELRIVKGQQIFIPILAINRSEALWGEDAGKFRPERWEKVPDGVHNVPSVFSNLLTFLEGPRHCIGYKFAIIEMKALLFTLLRSFEVELAVPVEHIRVKHTIVSRPMVETDLKAGYQLPIVIRRCAGRSG